MRLASWLLVAVLAAGAGGCASGPSAEEWAGKVCTALEPWKSGIDELTDETNAAMSSDSSASQTRKDLRKLLSGAAGTTERARADVAAAGIPDVEDGEDIARRFTDSLAATRDAYRDAHDGIAKLDASSGDFYDDVALVMKRLSKDYREVPQVARLDSDELRDAFESAQRCR